MRSMKLFWTFYFEWYSTKLDANTFGFTVSLKLRGDHPGLRSDLSFFKWYCELSITSSEHDVECIRDVMRREED